MATPHNHDPSVHNEPHLRRATHEVDPSEAKAERVLADESCRKTVDTDIEHSVWDEPALSRELTADYDGPRLTYVDWLSWRCQTTSIGVTWTVTLLVMLAAGPWAIVGSLLRGATSAGWGWAMIVVIAPVTEELMKIAVALWVVEKRPFLFHSSLQIMLCSVAGGLAFAAIENVFYLYLYFPDAAPTVAVVRWTVCVALHTSCSTLAGIGLIRIWSRAMASCEMPRLSHGVPWGLAAILLHGLYNAVASFADLF